MNRHSKYALLGIIAVVTGSPSFLRASVIADFLNDYQQITPKAGWSYLWNDAGPIGSPANYTPLLWDSARNYYDVTGSGVYPAAGNGGYSAVGLSNLPPSPNTHPGLGSWQSSDGIEHYTILAYTLSSSGATSLINVFGQNVDASTDGINLYVGVDSGGSVVASFKGLDPVGTIPLGDLSAGDTIYVGIGPGNTDFSDTTYIEFQVDQEAVPEPSSLGLLGIGGLSLLRRRQSRARDCNDGM